MAEHSASVVVKAPIHQVYALFTHFNDFPKFMRFVKEVTYYDDQRSHWVAHVLRDYEWDAVNEDWLPNQQIGWRSTSGLRNTGRVKFRALSSDRTEVDVYISYVPPSGTLGQLGETFVAGSHFDTVLKEDLQHFAQMVEQAPEGALDPMSSHYLFHPSSAAALKTVTPRQAQAMAQDPRMSATAMSERQARIEREANERRAAELARQDEEKRQRELSLQAEREHRTLVEREQAKRLAEQRAREAELAALEAQERIAHPVHDTLGGRNASKDRTAFGDRDGLRPRHPRYQQSDMTARYPIKGKETQELSEEELKRESPWLHSIRGNPEQAAKEDA